MQLKTIRRKLSAKELRLLRLILKNRENELQTKNSLRFFLVSLAVAVTFAFIASKLEDGIMLFLTGTIAVFAFIAFIFSIAPTVKERIGEKKFVRELAAYIKDGFVTVNPINALNIAAAGEYQDESNLFIIEYEKDKILFYWDLKYSLFDKFPCTNFEIYDEVFTKFADRDINFLSPKIDTEIISERAKWNYLKKVGTPAHLEIMNKNFKDLVDEINGYA